jgi:hypothetical protein
MLLPLLMYHCQVKSYLSNKASKRLASLEANQAAVSAFFVKQQLSKAIALLGAASKGDEDVSIGTCKEIIESSCLHVLHVLHLFQNSTTTSNACSI